MAAAWPSGAELTAIEVTALSLHPRFGVEVQSSDLGPLVYIGRLSGGDDAIDAEDSYCLFRVNGSPWVQLGDMGKPFDSPARYLTLAAALQAMRNHYAAR